MGLLLAMLLKKDATVGAFRLTKQSGPSAHIDYDKDRLVDVHVASNSYSVELYSKERTVAIISVLRDEQGVNSVDVVEWDAQDNPKIKKLLDNSKP